MEQDAATNSLSTTLYQYGETVRSDKIVVRTNELEERSVVEVVERHVEAERLERDAPSEAKARGDVEKELLLI